ncbi:AraC family transcriptional regulator [Cohnella sp. REN36]|uniref:AraC family transcriptional regulator n=1 Tax=Cohnella sp. REN36 TaxID=2887347 RepID=UPI001D1415F8|nr:AraC family transcriptional regulator [Cohnella sp. REN36]MCC3374491.1 AraC family transcriptional regulator [Cohnella sp. REN36]
MDWPTRMENALDFIETHLMEESLSVETIAKASFSSPFHFQRMFHMWTGITLGEYVRKRKLTLAAQQFAASSAKVVDVALQFGYESPEAFSKAFRKVHGVPPSEARQTGVPLKAFPRVSIQFSEPGEEQIDYRIVDKEAFTVVGKSAELVCGNEGRSRPWFWKECRLDGTLAKIEALETDMPLLGITANFDEEFTYRIAREADPSSMPDGLISYTIPSATWAIFSWVGPLPDAIQNGFRSIYRVWFPATDFEHAGLPEIEAYLPGDTRSEGYRCEAWIPILKK